MKCHPKAPKKLIQAFKESEWKYHKLAKRLDVNPGHVYKLLKKGIEPKREDLRRKVFLRPKRTPEELEELRKNKPPMPEYLRQWNKLSKMERHKVMQQYIRWRNKDGSNEKNN